MYLEAIHLLCGGYRLNIRIYFDFRNPGEDLAIVVAAETQLRISVEYEKLCITL